MGTVACLAKEYEKTESDYILMYLYLAVYKQTIAIVGGDIEKIQDATGIYSPKLLHFYATCQEMNITNDVNLVMSIDRQVVNEISKRILNIEVIQ